MAFGQRQIPVLDQQPRRGIGVGLPFNTPGVFRNTYTTRDALKTNLISYLLTEPGEIVFDPDRGGGLQKFIFEQAVTETAGAIEDYTATRIKNQFPNLEVDVTVTQNTNENSVYILITYKVLNTDITDAVELNILNGQ